ncbi:hypothetical protein [Paenibacillus macerans]|uniref:hypothetical protein n=1 Tax=Paenibacillus macerans TaxID=44252 RepID=UPI003D312197
MAGDPMNLNAEPVPIMSDPWLTTLAAWSETALGPEWKAHCGVWPPDAAPPAVLWRMIGMDVRVLGPSSFEVRKRMTAFFQTDDTDQEHAAVLRLLEGLGAAIKIPLDGGAARRYLRIVEPKMSVPTEGTEGGTTAAGPLTVTLIQRTAKPSAEAPLMQFVQYQSKMR